MSETNQPITVLYDAECPLCTRLAQYAQHHTGSGIAYSTWQEFRTSAEAVDSFNITANTSANELCIVAGDTMLQGSEAWLLLLKLHPSLHSFAWIASKLGLQGQAARSLNRVGHLLKKLCSTCPR
ncbi:hypothetical protein SCG7086_AD_00210 [Chlamydiales bacterium SCGC AG-110-P3]|nr:hypothetical protein SCG7086_AD_00210 [Chlamydiales bacterium SCGC AG-110-P3]